MHTVENQGARKDVIAFRQNIKERGTLFWVLLHFYLLTSFITICLGRGRSYVIPLILRLHAHLQWKPLNVITLGQRHIDSNNRLIIISEWTSTYIKYERVVCNLSIWIILIPLTDWSYYPWSPTVMAKLVHRKY
jgi:hypothetical protein